MMPKYYEFACPVKIVSGLKALANLPYEMGLLGAHRALIVTDQGVSRAGLIDRVREVFKGSDCQIGVIYDETPVDSSSSVVNEVARRYRDHACDCLVAVGGGSCMDTAKGANMLVAEDTDDLMQFQGAERLRKPTEPFIAVPTTAGTGSEVTFAAVIKDEATHTKLAFTSYKLFPDVAILDPKMTLTVPPKITAATGMDALTHAIEAYYCLQKNPVSDAFSLAAIHLTMDHLIPCVENGEDEQHRLAMANAALLAGISFSNSMVGVVHALAHATGGVWGVPHGVANGIFLPWGMESNLERVPETIAELAGPLGADAGGSVNDQAKAAVDAVCTLRRRLNHLCGLPITLRDAQVPEDQLEAIAKAAVNDGSVTYNPEAVTCEDALALLKKAY
ncbi:MAG TPA: iron-containing alcohol dehydrogenase [Candidatus Hydrogenedentes bacterium]|mgnify:CR=1 FL=1|nr:iron-containing alcohol dehydrogenase [Candidatus Hydrogenedentota bacterium]